MNLQDAIKILKERAFVVEVREVNKPIKNGEKWELVYDWGVSSVKYTSRELIAFARNFTSEKSERWAKFLKKNSAGRQRTFERNCIQSNDFDKLPHQPRESKDDWI